MRATDEGQGSAEYIGMIVVVVLVVAGLLTLAIGKPLRAAVDSALCAIEGGACVLELDDARDEDVADPRVAAVLAGLAALDGYARTGSATATLARAVRDAVAQGEVAQAEALLRQLALYADLAGMQPRGKYLGTLFGASDAEFRGLVGQGTMYADGGAYNLSYVQLDPVPGGGVVVMDFFIASVGSGVLLRGDDRGHADPLRGDVALERSRMMLVVDLDTGRGQVHVTETCTRGVHVCNEPRPSVFDGSLLSDDTGTAPVIPLRDNDYDVANQFTFKPAEDGFRLDYDALNGIIPVGSVDGHVTVRLGADGELGIGDDDRDNYPSIGMYYYRAPGETQVVQQREQEMVVCGGLPVNLC